MFLNDSLKKIRQVCISIILLVLFSSHAPLFSQTGNCVDMPFFDELYGESLEEISAYLSKNKWLLLSSETDEPLVLEGDTLLFNLVVWKNTRSSEDQYVYLYHKSGISNFLEVVASEECYDKLLTNVDGKFGNIVVTKNEGGHIRSEYRISEAKQIVFYQQFKNSFSYHIICYNPLEINELISEHKSAKLQSQLIYQQKKEHVENLLKQCNSLMQKDDYEGALALIEDLRGYLPEYDQEIASRKEKYKEAIKKRQIAEMTAEAEQLLEDRNLQEAKSMYEKILRVDRENQTALIRVEQIKNMLEVLYLRSDILYDYKVLNPDSWHLINNQLQTEINNAVKRSRSGSLDFNFTVYMDTIGRNVSFYTLSKNSDNYFEKFMKDLVVSPMLKPTYKENISVASRYNFHHTVDWRSYDFNVKKGKNRIKTATEYQYLLNQDAFKRFINDTILPRGKYAFEIKEKTLDTRQTLVDVNLKKYKVVGREAFFYSLLLPGSGTMAATHGKKGYFSFFGFFAGGGLSLAAYLQSEKLEKRAEDPNRTPTEYDLGKQAKNLRIASYAGFSITGAIYITEAFRAMAKGGQNMKASRELRRSIRNSPKEVISQEIKIN